MKLDNKKRRSKKRRPAGYYGGWERKRIVKAKKFERNVKTGKWVGEYLKEYPEHKHLKTVIILGIMMNRYGFSLRETMSKPYFRRGSRKAAGLKRVPSMSWPRKRLKRAPVDLPDGLIPFAAGKAAYGPFSVDSAHHRFNRYALVDHSNVKGGWPTRASATSWPLRTARCWPRW